MKLINDSINLGWSYWKKSWSWSNIISP